MQSAEPNVLSDADWDRHQGIIAGFEQAWKLGERPRISSHLPDDEPHRDELLVELVHADLEFRIKAGESARVEDYLRRYPSLRRVKKTVLDLIQAECSIRRQREPGLKLDRFRKRFPEFRSELEGPPGEASTEDGPRSPAAGGGKGLPAAEAPLPRRFGKFELREKLGVGSSGVVYRAWDTVLKREVAIKLPRVEGATLGHELRMFLRDARSSLDLKHPNIVAILDAGPVDGVDCMVRAYIKGQTLADRLREGPVTPRDTATLVAVVAEAVDYAHCRGIIHRDLKPSNILIDLQGQPHVMDFGLAKHEAGESTLSPAGSATWMIGTPAYMSPEQARGETLLVDARSDVYTLGVVLYELLTGSLPFRGRGRMLQIQIEEAEPLAPRSLNDEVPAELETICLKALAKAPDGRYQAAQALADDLRNFLEGRPVGARAGSAGRTARKPWWKSKRRISSLAAWSIVLIALASMTASWRQAEARRARAVEGLERGHRALLDLARAGEPGNPNPKKGPAARAWDLARELDSTLDGDPALIELAADTRLGLARRATAEGSDKASGPLWDRAIQACEASLLQNPGRAARLEDLAGALDSRAKIWGRAGKPEIARGLSERSILRRTEALEDFHRRSETDPDGNTAQLDLAEVLFRLAETRKALDEPADIHHVELKARECGRHAASASPGFRRRLIRLLLEISRWRIADVPSQMAVDPATEAYRIAQQDDTSAQLLARTCLARAKAESEAGRKEAAIVWALDGVRRFGALVGPGPGRLEDRRWLGNALGKAGRYLERAGRRSEAVSMHLAALRVWLELDRDYPLSHTSVAEIGEARLALSRAFELDGRTLRSLVNRLLATFDLARAFALAPGDASYRAKFTDAAKGLAPVIRGQARASLTSPK